MSVSQELDCISSILITLSHIKRRLHRGVSLDQPISEHISTEILHLKAQMQNLMSTQPYQLCCYVTGGFCNPAIARNLSSTRITKAINVNDVTTQSNIVVTTRSTILNLLLLICQLIRLPGLLGFILLFDLRLAQ